jgi:hypothetical protein
MRTDSGKGVRVFAHDLMRQRRPTPSWIADATEPPLVLEHQPHRFASRRLARDFFLNQSREFFLNSSWLAGSARGCRGRGTILRHPWRANIRYTVDFGTVFPAFRS